MSQSFAGPAQAGYCPRCHRGYAVGPHVCPAPQRIQLKRTKGWRMPPNTEKVDRSTRWGNPFRADLIPGYRVEDAVRDFRCWVVGEPAAAKLGNVYWKPPTVEEIRRELAGKNLACWCRPGAPCHADVLLEIANG